MEKKHAHKSYLGAALACHCPRCREGKLFKNRLSIRVSINMEMFERCPLCKQPTDIEVGFYYGTGYISYLLCVIIVIVSFLLWLVTIGFSFHDQRFLIWLISTCLLLAILQPWLMRFSRVLWLSFFVKYDSNWKHHQPQDPERIIKEQMNNW